MAWIDRLPQGARQIAQTGLDAIYPHRCAFCKAVCEPVSVLPGFCRSCLSQIPFRNKSQSLIGWAELGASDYPPGGIVICATWYRDPIRSVLLRLKFGDSPDLGEALAGILLQQWNRLALDCQAVLAVPLHKLRERERGYNQAGLLAAFFARQIDRPDWSAKLVRCRYTERQSSLVDRDARRGNLAGAFSLRDTDLPVTHDRCPRRPVLLIDDILTTGATLVEAARPLVDQGFTVIGLVLSSERQPRERII